MNDSHHPSLADRFASTLEVMRASVAAEGTRKTPAGVLQAAILSLLECLLALLREFEAGRLAASEPGAAGAAEKSPTSPSRCAGPAVSACRGRNGELDRGGFAAQRPLRPLPASLGPAQRARKGRNPSPRPSSPREKGETLPQFSRCEANHPPALCHRRRFRRSRCSYNGVHYGIVFQNRVADAVARCASFVAYS